MTQITQQKLRIYDFDDTLVHQSLKIDGNLVRLPALSYLKFCQALEITQNDAEKCKQFFKTNSDLAAFKHILGCPWQSTNPNFKL